MNALYCCLSVAAALAISNAALITKSVTTTADPKCHGLECPSYSVVNKTAAWELRRYPVTQWVSTNSTGADIQPVNSEMFQYLFKYISGANDKHMKIPMTSPVVTKIAHGQGPTCASIFTMHFMVPFEDQSAPAAPSDPKVFLSSLPAMDVFVKTFGGYATDDDYINNLHQLAQDVTKVSKVNTDFFYRVGYDGPYQFTNRHNEVWLVKE